jgi:hypothetical protein
MAINFAKISMVTLLGYYNNYKKLGAPWADSLC